jgi:hypothetical protein
MINVKGKACVMTAIAPMAAMAIVADEDRHANFTQGGDPTGP